MSIAPRLDRDPVMTPRQKEVLDLLVKGRTNGQIATELGISLDGAKWHVSEVITKLGVDTREEAADYWRGRNGLRPRLRRWVAAAAPASFPLRWVGIGATASVGVIAAVALAVVFVSQGSGESQAVPTTTPPPGISSATPTGSSTAPGTPTATVTVQPTQTIGGVPASAFSRGPNGTLGSSGAVMYVEGGCSGCDGPPTSIDRVYTDQAGVVHTDKLFERTPDPESSGDPEYITSIATSADGYTIAVGVCEAGAYCGGVGNVEEGAKVTVHFSQDGGATWRPIGTLERGARVLSAAWDGVLVQRSYRASPGADLARAFVVLRDTVQEPIGGQYNQTWEPVMVGYDGAALLAADGTALWALAGGPEPVLAPELPAGATLRAAQPNPAGGWVVIWDQAAGNAEAPPGIYAGPLKERTGQPERIFRFPDDIAFFSWDGAWLGPNRALMNVLPGSGAGSANAIAGPVVVDFATGEIQAVTDYFPERMATGDRARLRALIAGPVVRVQGAGDCLNVRQAASTAAASLGCYADGVLLRDRGETRAAEGITWVGVWSVQGVPGWASAEFLDTAGRDMSITPTGQQPGVRTGNPDIDPVLEAIESGDPADIVAATKYTQIECLVNPQGLGAPPQCPDGVADGTVVETLPTSHCEGSYELRASFEANPTLPMSETATLWAVYQVAPGATQDPAWPRGPYVVIYTEGTGDQVLASAVFIDAGKIVNRARGCGALPTDYVPAGGTVVLAPPS